MPPDLTDSRTPVIAFSTILLPEVRPVISIASSIGTPAEIRPENVREKRASATFWTIPPILNGIFSLKLSHCSRPRVDFFHFLKRTTLPQMPPISRYQRCVKRCETKTVSFVIAGS